MLYEHCMNGNWSGNFDRDVQPPVIDSNGNILGWCSSISYDHNYPNDCVTVTMRTNASFVIDDDKRVRAIQLKEGDNHAI